LNTDNYRVIDGPIKTEAEKTSIEAIGAELLIETSVTQTASLSDW